MCTVVQYCKIPSCVTDIRIISYAYLSFNTRILFLISRYDKAVRLGIWFLGCLPETKITFSLLDLD